jgi:selenide, water dikinase
MQQTMPDVQDLCLIGGGHTHALILKMWSMDPLPGVRVTVVNPGPLAAYSGMLPGFVAGHYPRDQIMIDLWPLSRAAGARFVSGRVVALDPQARRVTLEGGRQIAFDLASINVGITSDLPDVPGFASHGHAAKPLGDFAARWAHFTAHASAHAQVVVIGGGVAGVELALAARHRLGPKAGVILLERGATLLPLLGPRARRALMAQLTKAGITVHLNTEPVEILADGLRLNTGEVIRSDFTLSAAGSRPPDWLAESGLDCEAGFLKVNAELQTSAPPIFAAGDCAALPDPRPKAGVFAVRQAPILFHNLQSALAGFWALQPYKPQRDYLKLISLGGQKAVAEKWGLAFSGAALWRWKDRIDQRFMDKLTNLPAMAQVKPPEVGAEGLDQALGTKPACGGCGAKIDGAALTSALAALPVPQRGDVRSGPGDDAAVLQIGGETQVITTDHLRTMVDDPVMMARIAAVHALGDIWAMGAEPQAALAQITLPRSNGRLAGRALSEIMEAAAQVFRAEGADVVGGHSSFGAELTIGFTVTGLAFDRVTAKRGARVGDLLVLTKPLGSGVIMAALMAGTQPEGLMLGECVEQALLNMTRPMGAEARALGRFAHAMTDVTGFGLTGHLLEMLAEDQGAELDLTALPLLPGAESLAGLGVASTLSPANHAASAPRAHLPDIARAALCFDPQTCGGLLAAIPPEALEELADLSPLWVIGRVTASGGLYAA